MSSPGPKRYRRVLIQILTVLALVLALQWWQARPFRGP